MNIHFTNKEAFELLKEASIFSIEIGSTMYGTTNEQSDKDLLHVYIPCIEELTSFVETHHQFQYKENGVDYLFVNIFQFFRNALNGDSTINFEVINHFSLENTVFDWVYKSRSIFANYRILKSYLGMARRDIKHLSKAKTIRDKNKRLAHVVRSYYFIQDILNKEFTPLVQNERLTEILTIHQLVDSRKRHELMTLWNEKIEKLRNLVNEKLDNHSLNLPYYMLPFHQKLLDDFIQNLIKEKNVTSSLYFELLKEQLYDINENGIIY